MIPTGLKMLFHQSILPSLAMPYLSCPALHNPELHSITISLSNRRTFRAAVTVNEQYELTGTPSPNIQGPDS